ncbi:MAG: hypothetical protein ABSH08_08305 [Tepidisphaeraceae bacterium]
MVIIIMIAVRIMVAVRIMIAVPAGSGVVSIVAMANAAGEKER